MAIPPRKVAINTPIGLSYGLIVFLVTQIPSQINAAKVPRKIEDRAAGSRESVIERLIPLPFAFFHLNNNKRNDNGPYI